jgi:hypothetical protein
MMTIPNGALRALMSPLDEAINRKIQRTVPAVTGLTRIGQYHPRDVFVIGYPKSGNTWLQNILAGLAYGVDPARSPDSLIQELVPDVHYKRYYKRFGTPMYFKSHDLPAPHYRRVVYILRDGRDAMVSYYHHLRALARTTVPDEYFMQMVETGRDLYPGHWHEHVRAWEANPYGAEMILLRYEDLQADRPRELARLCEFLGIEPDGEAVSAVAERTSFVNMAAREARSGWDNRAWPTDKKFVRRGVVGSYRDEMPEGVYSAFMERAGQTLQQYGYE